MLEVLILIAIGAVVVARLVGSGDASASGFNGSPAGDEADQALPWIIPSEDPTTASGFRSGLGGLGDAFAENEDSSTTFCHEWGGGCADFGLDGTAYSSSLSWETMNFDGMPGPCINPATGLPMMSDSMAGLDVGGNAYGFTHDDTWNNQDLFDGGGLGAGGAHESWGSQDSGGDWS